MPRLKIASAANGYNAVAVHAMGSSLHFIQGHFHDISFTEPVERFTEVSAVFISRIADPATSPHNAPGRTSAIEQVYESETI